MKWFLCHSKSQLDGKEWTGLQRRVQRDVDSNFSQISGIRLVWGQPISLAELTPALFEMRPLRNGLFQSLLQKANRPQRGEWVGLSLVTCVWKICILGIQFLLKQWFTRSTHTHFPRERYQGFQLHSWTVLWQLHSLFKLSLKAICQHGGHCRSWPVGALTDLQPSHPKGKTLFGTARKQQAINWMKNE